MDYNILVKESGRILRLKGRLGNNMLAYYRLIMKLTLFLTFFFTFEVAAYTHAQKINIEVKNAPMKSVLQELRKKSGYAFIYNDRDLDKAAPVSAKINDQELLEILPFIFEGQPLSYTIKDKLINITPKKMANGTNISLNMAYQEPIIGRVIDEKGQPLAGATIFVLDKDGKRTNKQTAADREGNFQLIGVADGAILEVSYLGHVPTKIAAKAQLGAITLKPSVTEMKEVAVVATGMTVRDKETFTGAASVYLGKELKAVGNVNVIQSLRSLDPSFLLIENNLAGSNPNVLPTIELRGQTSITTTSLRDEFSDDPNQPLFILDGFEASLRTIVDLDMNRVSSITVLKDAASTAIYGSRASNGVVVVETIQPKAGQIRLGYTTDMTLEYPDLSAYNMMNASEKLQFEKLSGVYNAPSAYPEMQNAYYDPLYSQKLQQVVSGVNSYWLSDPLQTGFSQRHTLYAEGGSQALTFNAGGNYRVLRGTMNGSGRKDWGVRLNLSYRSHKLKINNNAYVNGYRADESNYGSFSTWVNMNPYYEKVSAAEPYVFSFYDSNSNTYYNPNVPTSYIRVSNPLYNASLNSFDYASNVSITNNLQLIYDLSKALRIQGSLQVSNSSTATNVFKSPLHTSFEDVEQLKKGTYQYKQTTGLSYTANAMVSYAKHTGKHAYQVNLRAELQDKTNRLKGFIAEGFPTSTNGNPRFAYGYQENGSPLAVNSVSRRNSLIANGYYSYDERYNADVSFTYDGSTSFGVQNSYQPFASFGLSWNINKEKFLKAADWIDNLRLRASYGVTGNQNFTSATSISTYSYMTSFNYFGQGVELTKLGNANLKWQNTYQTNLGLDAALFNNRFTLQVNAYRKYTNPLVIAIGLPTSTSLADYAINAGNLNTKGIEANIRFAPIYKPAERFTWFVGVTSTVMSQKYNGFNNILSGLNESLQSLNSLTRYKDGYDFYDLWTVPSLGIDPASGREIFLKKDGTQSFTYSYDDVVKVGNSRPDFQGVISNTLSYKGLTFAVYARYIINRDVWNDALFNKVENVSLNRIINNNLDARALYDRWQQPGDQAQFRAVSLTSTTNMSSRFVQKENALSIESVSLGYEFKKNKWMDKVGVSNLRLNGFTNDLFYLSTVRRERGVDYPFARSFSFSLTANIQ
ncbi:SusC/RagA family TonB-linked outer membrane protein [Pedobacter sp. ASV28]|uniref:SusC/RagA family TonB-linked outer membrane protein n=1 Tax=Pedobacter sp. ASV28 TaxID=2795123 RepID=UPI0018EE1D2A|nr:SusC/RagA family TonB-linked outer membrane protein [Pedobacter sp. ASV28]